MHILAENANSLIENIAVALKFDANNNQLDNLINISIELKEVFFS